MSFMTSKTTDMDNATKLQMGAEYGAPIATLSMTTKNKILTRIERKLGRVRKNAIVVELLLEKWQRKNTEGFAISEVLISKCTQLN